mmetsp:Transcript_7322/g.23011  ORF Transcript_7322/g.23011 Transcript_7322/m.23011 type:complete len:84 (+) Transcript_7322:35-286(+)
MLQKPTRRCWYVSLGHISHISSSNEGSPWENGVENEGNDMMNSCVRDAYLKPGAAVQPCLCARGRDVLTAIGWCDAERVPPAS